ncbi:hypothetical protein AQUCO_03800001v1 [Aquilegia coerulea]|uniref:Hydroxyproline-rich glycoprotein family protein n=1 Tax=Aquilegia coerulea TaxID=218851 RepID=A0A2G5CTC7_AQUCA|nr:hypothetical protein AQUCO_03800001v1 [Aquilegia coerulea]
MSMAGNNNNGGVNNNNNGRNGGASISAAASAIGSPDTRFPRQERRRRWGGCWGGLSCFGSQKGGKRVVPASRMPEGHTSGNRANGAHPVGMQNQATTINLSLLAPPSSPASFTNSALPSTVQSPSCFLSMSASSPSGPSNVYATGPYAHETQLVSPPVFSTFTTEPSTAPFTPPPELNHFTTPSSPDVPFALTFSSAMDLKSTSKSSYVTANDLQATYPLYPESPASSLISPISGTSGDGLSSSFPDREFPARWGAAISSQDSYLRSSSSRLFGLDAGSSRNFMLSQDSSFFYPATSAQFYLDQAHSGGRISVSREADVQSSNGQHNRHKNCKPDVEELEAYRASFGFSADEIITTPHYVEISDDILDDSFTMAPLASDRLAMEENTLPATFNRGGSAETTYTNVLDSRGLNSVSDQAANMVGGKTQELGSALKDHNSPKQSADISGSLSDNQVMTDDEDIFSRMGNSKIKRYQLGLSSSDAEIDYRRGRSLRERKGDFSWGD